MPPWVNYKQIREDVRFTDVLAHYQIELRINGQRASGLCPLPGHAGRTRSPSFSANINRGIWQCFGCRAKGNVIDFIAYMENLDPRDTQDFRKAAIMAQERFLSSSDHQPTRSEAPAPGRQPLTSDKPVLVNAPLDFQLKNLDSDHPYLVSRGFTAETINHFSLGYCSKGFMEGRVVIPLHDAEGQFIGYAGRLVDDAAVTKENPKYRFPGRREHKGTIHEFRKSAFVYNGHAIQGPVDSLIVVEGFPSVWWLWQHGFHNVVALMGSTCGEAQADIIVRAVAPTGRIRVFTDGDSAGERCGKACVLSLSCRRFVTWINLEDQRQPTDCTSDELDLLLSDGHGITPK